MELENLLRKALMNADSFSQNSGSVVATKQKQWSDYRKWLDEGIISEKEMLGIAEELYGEVHSIAEKHAEFKDVYGHLFQVLNELAKFCSQNMGGFSYRINGQLHIWIDF